MFREIPIHFDVFRVIPIDFDPYNAIRVILIDFDVFRVIPISFDVLDVLSVARSIGQTLELFSGSMSAAVFLIGNSPAACLEAVFIFESRVEVCSHSGPMVNTSSESSAAGARGVGSWRPKAFDTMAAFLDAFLTFFLIFGVMVKVCSET